MSKKDAAAPDVQPEPDRVRNHKLTRHGMEYELSKGRSILYKGNTLTSIHQLPSEAELAEGDEQASADALKTLDAQQKIIDGQRAKLLASHKPAEPAKDAKPDKK